MGAAPSPRPSLFAALLSAALLLLLPSLVSGGLVAQEPGTPASSAERLVQDPPASADAPTPPAAPAQDEPVVFGKIVAEKVRLHCWASAVSAPPQFEDAFEKDQVVRLGRSENGFRQVILPLGPIGYVSKRFAAEGEGGVVVTKGTKVAFRYRPRTTEAPVAQLPDGTPMHVIGGASDEDAASWYRVRVEGVDAWIAAGDVQVVDGSDPKVVAAYEAIEKQARAVVQARLDAIAAAQAKQKQDEVDLAAVRVVEAALSKEMAKAMDEQEIPPLKTALDKVEGTLADDSGARPAVALLQKKIEAQHWIVEAYRFNKAKPPEPEQPVVVEAPKDRLQRFESIGWLRYERHLTGPGVFYLEKGGRRQFELSCNTGRYDLALFVGREVGVIGPRRSPISETMTVLDVERIEVLGMQR